MGKRVLIVVALALTALPLLPLTAGADADTYRTERHLVGLINKDRKAHKLRPLSIDKTLTNIGRKQAKRMSEDQELYHNSWLFSDDGQDYLDHPKATGENVGAGGGAKPVHEGMMNSKEHRTNILRSVFTTIGVGVVRDHAGVIWVSEVFTRPKAGSPGVAPLLPPARVVRTRPDAGDPARATSPDAGGGATNPAEPSSPPAADARSVSGPETQARPYGRVRSLGGHGFWQGSGPLGILGGVILLAWALRAGSARRLRLRTW